MTASEAIISDIQRTLGARFVVDKVEQNWKPHQYIISNEAAKWLTRHCHGITSPDNMFTVERVLDARCMQEGCGKRFHEHEYKNIVFIHLRINVGYQYAQTRLKAMEAVLKMNGMDGYRITKNEFKILPRKVKS